MKNRTVRSGDHAQGPEAAPVTLLEYGDYECPYCRQAYLVVKAVQRSMGSKLRFAFRDFPLIDLHPHALAAACAAEAAALQGKFWEMTDALFEQEYGLGLPALVGYAEELELDMEVFTYDLRSAGILVRVQADVEKGLRDGVHGTPTFFVNGAPLNGPWKEMLPALQQAASGHSRRARASQ